MKRRGLLKGVIGLGAAAGAGYWWLHRSWDGYLLNPCQSPLPQHIQNSELWKTIWKGINPSLMLDGHVHIAGTGDSAKIGPNKGQPSIWANPKMETWSHPWQHLQYNFYMNAACAEIQEAGQTVDNLYVERLLSLVNDMPQGVKLALLAFDYHHNEYGQAVPDSSTFYVPNEYAQKIAAQYPERFEWAASVHPYRKDALQQLEKAVEAGAVGVKWLPPAQNIDPASAKCDDFYKLMAKHNLTLICHTGEEKAVEGSDTQKFGNALRLRRALDHGVKVVVSHCASLGHDVDMDNNNKPTSHFELFTRMMADKQYEGLLFGDISATTQINRDPQVLKTLLSETSWNHRLVNCSDYPIPSVMPLISLKRLVKHELLDDKWREPLNELREYNAILFDFAVKRLLSYKGQRFAESIFETLKVYRTD
ncbi:MAG: amidohydrolase family protein [Kangiellaceae bacterium]|nr:amidohydrolase family protein [Kangiellaceae bacterium]